MKKRILVTDDDPNLISMYRALLDPRDDVAVDYASTPSACKSLVASKTYDAAWLDISLNDPVEDGFTLLQLIHSRSPDTAVMMMSSMDNGATVDRCLQLGARKFTSKNQDFARALRCEVARLGAS
jgi:DNA-binding NarL/FixJ family response regulator